MSVLNQICTQKKEHIRLKKSQISESDIKIKAEKLKIKQRFKSSLLNKSLNNEIALIAEVKKASPSNGIIRENFNPLQIAKEYETAGAACLSILTDEPYFKGHDTYMQQIRAATNIPLLRKDFMIEPYQIYESRLLGADCILLIMAALNDSQASEMAQIAKELGMDVLCEVHDRDELGRAIDLNFDMIGINNRNLKTLEVSLENGIEMASLLPENVLKVAESGILNHADILNLKNHGFQGFLVGESLMREDDIINATRKLLGK